eukprot:Gb_07369 [translate_table: standard]
MQYHAQAYQFGEGSYGERTSLQLAGQSDSSSRLMSPLERIERLASENAVVVFSISSCCMCHVVKRLFCGLGVNLTVYELDEEHGGKEMEKALIRLMGGGQSVPAVFVGGKLVGTISNNPWCSYSAAQIIVQA